MAPDLDVLISSNRDPLMFLEYHRQFTHSLIFIPLGAAIVAGALWVLWGRRHGWPLAATYLYCFLGYATHALLDACTSYGTMLFWPFSDYRVAWNNVSIIDPLLTLPLILAVILSRWWKKRLPALLGLIWVVAYLSIGVHARDVAAAAGAALATERGHSPLRVDAKPSFANLLLWKTVYRDADRYYVDAVLLGPRRRVYEGDSVPALDVARDLPWLDSDSQQATDIERFRWFSEGYIALDPHNANRVVDLRYSLLPNEARALWGIELARDADSDAHARYVVERDASGPALSRLWAMLRGKG
jgi:inner membrane protein